MINVAPWLGGGSSPQNCRMDCAKPNRLENDHRPPSPLLSPPQKCGCFPLADESSNEPKIVCTCSRAVADGWFWVGLSWDVNYWPLLTSACNLGVNVWQSTHTDTPASDFRKSIGGNGKAYRASRSNPLWKPWTVFLLNHLSTVKWFTFRWDLVIPGLQFQAFLHTPALTVCINYSGRKAPVAG